MNKILFSLLFSFLGASVQVHAKQFSIMAPLGLKNEQEWAKFERDLQTFSRIGVQSVSTDLWWGEIEGSDNQYDWSIPDRMSALIFKYGMKWTPILAFNKCGGNVGDDCDIPLPQWIWKKYLGNSLKYKSEQSHYTEEIVSVWATEIMIQDYIDFTIAFREHYSPIANKIQEITTALGPATELRYPSYNAHDINVGYPTRGALQCYSDLAVKSFQNYAQEKYGTIQEALSKWGIKEFRMPKGIDELLDKLSGTVYGNDFSEWYQESLFNHGHLIITTLSRVLAERDEFKNIPMGVRLSGVHWRLGRMGSNQNIIFGDRGAEVSTGLITLSKETWTKTQDYGYGKILDSMKNLEESISPRPLIVHFTAIEMDDGRDGPEAMSLAKTLTRIIAVGASKRSLYLKGENALAGTLGDPRAWDNISEALNSGFSGVNILRTNMLSQIPRGADLYRHLIERHENKHHSALNDSY
jgi:beta-amylase